MKAMSQAMKARPASLSAPPKMTYREFLEWADEETRAEWVDGEVVFLITSLTLFVRKRSLGRVLYAEFQMKLGAGLPGRQPDVIFLSAAHLPRLKKNYLDGPADLMVEIVSPESVERDTVQKFAEYQQGGVLEYWLIDPLTQEASFFQRDAHGRFEAAARDSDGTYSCAVLPGFRLRPEWLWQASSLPLTEIWAEMGLP